MSNKLLKELKESRDKEFSPIENIPNLAKEAEVLLLGAHDEDVETMSRLGLQIGTPYERKLEQDYKRTKEAKKIYGRESFTGKQIKDLCIAYNLKLLKIDDYTGSIPASLPRLIREFAQTKEVNVHPNNFFILAPVSEFKTKKHVDPKPIDPILFYREHNKHTSHHYKASEKDVFTQVHNWGNDFTFWRKLAFMTSDSSYSEDGSWAPMTRTVWFGMFNLIGMVAALVGQFWIGFTFVMVSVLFMLAQMGRHRIDEWWNTDEV